MKKQVSIFTAFLFLFAIAFVSCNKEELALEEEALTTQEGDSEMVQPIIAVPYLDLDAPAYVTNITTTTTACGPVLPDMSCANPAGHGFMATIGIRNNGPATLPAGTIQVLWRDLTFGINQIQLVSHGPIQPGRIIRASRNYYLGPCDCTGGPTFFTRSFDAVIDPNNLIPEINNNNNTTPTYTGCDGC